MPKEQLVLDNVPRIAKNSIGICSPCKHLNTEERDYYCCSCGKKYTKQSGNFPATQSVFFVGNNHFLPICKRCLAFFEVEYARELGSSDEGLRRLAAHWDYYVSDEIIDMSRRVNQNQPRITALVSKNFGMGQFAGKTYDTYLKECDSTTITSIEDLQEAQKSQDINVTERTVKAWGFGFSPEDYEFLNMQFSDWKARVVVDSKTRESLVKELCVLKLQMNKAIQNDSIELYNKLMSTYTGTLDKASLLPKQEEAADKSGEKPIGVMIEMFENERPIPPPEDEWLNSSMFKLVTVYFIGHLCKMLGIKNKYSQMYEDEMDKYRVEVPELENAEDDDIFDYLVNDNNDSITDTDIGEILNG